MILTMPCVSLVVWVGIAMAPVAAANVRLPDAAQLARAVRSKDDVEIERVASRLGARKLLRITENGKREERLAALRGLGLVEDGWAVLPEIARQLGDPDLEVGNAAARAANQLVRALSPETIEQSEIPRDVLSRAASELLAVSRRADLKVALRVSAIGTLATLRGVQPIDEALLATLLSDGESEVRRAAAEALGGVKSQEAPVMRALEEDVASVASTAAASLCRDVPVSGEKGAAFERAKRLSPKARQRLRALAVDESAALVDRLELLPCLRVAAQPEDQKILDQLAKGKIESLKRRARSLGGR